MNQKHKMMHYSNFSSKLDLLNVSVGKFGPEEGQHIEEYYKPQEPEYFKNQLN